jgi:hypothetical protein
MTRLPAGFVYQLRNGVPWRLLPVRELGCGSRSPAGGGCATGSAPGWGRQLHHLLLDELGTRASSIGPAPAWTA